MATLASMTVRLGVDTNPFARGLNRASERLRGFQRDANGQLRDMRGRFVREGGQSGVGFARGLSRGIRSGLSGLTSAASQLAKNPYVAAAGAAIAAGLGAMIASTMVISLSGVAVIGLSYMLLKEEPAVQKAAGKLKNTAIDVMRDAAKPMAEPLAEAFGAVEQTMKDLKPQFKEMFQTVADSGILKNLTRGLDKFMKNVMPGFNSMLEDLKPAFEGIEYLMGKVGEGLGGFFKEIGKSGPSTKIVLEGLGDAIKTALIWAGKIIAFLSRVSAKVKLANDAISAGFTLVRDKIAAAWEYITTKLGQVVAWFKALPGRIWGALTRFVSNIVTKMTEAKNRAVSGAKSLVSRAVGWVKKLPGRAWAALSSWASKMWDRATSAGRRLVSGISQKISDAVAKVRGLPGRAISALGRIGSKLYNSGRSLISGFVRGIWSKIGDVARAASSVVSRARDFFPFSPAKEGPFSGKGWTLYSGASLIDGFRKGIAQQAPYLRRQMNDVLGEVPNMRAEVSGVVRAGRAKQEPQRLVIDVTGADDGMKRMIRRMVRVDGHGDVQVAFGRS